VAEAYALAEDVPSLDSAWAVNLHHKIVYAAAGVLHLQSRDGQWLLPPQRAAWVRAGTEHRLIASEPVSVRTVYLSPSMMEPSSVICAVFDVHPLAREMILGATRWGPARDANDDRANRYFLAFAALCSEWLANARPFRLPVARSPELSRAMDHALAQLSREPSIEEAAEVAGVSPRTLARRFREEANTTWREFVHDARMMRAMVLLADRDTSVTHTAHQVGFTSLGAFTRAFVDYTGERPRDYRRRITDTPED
jgi:AraC-like DNA-binding protein